MTRGRRSKFDVRVHVVLHAVTDDHASTAWIHTHGMRKLGTPELEMRKVPLLLVPSAARLMNRLAEHVLLGCTDNPHVHAGDVMRLDENLGCGSAGERRFGAMQITISIGSGRSEALNFVANGKL